MNFEQLKAHVANIESQNTRKHIPSKYDMDILDLEDYLVSLGADFKFSINLAKIVGDIMIGERFKSSEYALEWVSVESKPKRLYLVNIPYKNRKLFINCPEVHKKMVLVDKERFISSLKESLNGCV